MKRDPNREKFRKLRKGHVHGLQWYALKGTRTLVCADTFTGAQLHVVQHDGFWVVVELASSGEVAAPVAHARRWQARLEVEKTLAERTLMSRLFMGLSVYATAIGLAACREWERGLL